MKTLEELRRENARLKAGQAVRADMSKRDTERKQLRRENIELKHGEKLQAVRATGRGLKVIGRGLGRGLIKLGDRFNEAQTSQQSGGVRYYKIKRVKKNKKPTAPKGYRLVKVKRKRRR